MLLLALVVIVLTLIAIGFYYFKDNFYYSNNTNVNGAQVDENAIMDYEDVMMQDAPLDVGATPEPEAVINELNTIEAQEQEIDAMLNELEQI